LLAAYALSKAVGGQHEVATFVLFSSVLVVAISRLSRTQARFESGFLVVRRLGFFGPAVQFALSKVRDGRYGALNGEAAIEFYYEHQRVRLGPWWGYDRKALDLAVKEFGQELQRAADSASGLE